MSRGYGTTLMQQVFRRMVVLKILFLPSTAIIAVGYGKSLMQ